MLLFPEDPHECFEFGAAAFDLADRLQTPVFVMLDLDIGMNEWLCEPLAWDDCARFDRGKVLTAEELEAGRSSAAISTSTATASPTAPIRARTRPRGAFFTRGTSRDRYARYTEEGAGLRRQHAAAAAQVRDREGARAGAGPRATRRARPATA